MAELLAQGFTQGATGAGSAKRALRLVLTGICPVHGRLFDRRAKFTEEFRGIAAGLGNLWLEKVHLATSRRFGLGKIFSEDNPIAGLLKSIEKLELDGDSLLELVPELATLKGKLPPELHTEDDPFLDLSSEKILDLRIEVQELLIAKLLHHGEKR